MYATKYYKYVQQKEFVCYKWVENCLRVNDVHGMFDGPTISSILKETMSENST